MTDSTNPIGEKEIREIMQQELIDRVQLLQRKTSSAGLRLQVPETETFIFAGPATWIAKNLRDVLPVAAPAEPGKLNRKTIVDDVLDVFRAAGFDVREHAGPVAISGSIDSAGILMESVMGHPGNIGSPASPVSAEQPGGLTYERVDEIASSIGMGTYSYEFDPAAYNRRFARAIEREVTAYLASQSQAEPVAYLHQVVAGDGEPDQALSFATDNFPLAGTLGYRSISHQPLFAAPLLGIEAQADQLVAEALAVFDLMLEGCRDQSFNEYENGDGETIGPRMDALHAKLRAFPAATASPDATPPNAEVLADEAALYRDLTGAAMKLGYDGIPAALEALRGVVVQEGETKGGAA